MDILDAEVSVALGDLGTVTLSYEGSSQWNRAMQNVSLLERDSPPTAFSTETKALLITTGAITKSEATLSDIYQYLIDNPITLTNLFKLVLERGTERTRELQSLCTDVNEYFRIELEYSEFPEDLKDRRLAKGAYKGFSVNDMLPELTYFQEILYKDYKKLHRLRSGGSDGPAKISAEAVYHTVKEGLTTVPLDVLMAAVLLLEDTYHTWYMNKREQARSSK